MRWDDLVATGRAVPVIVEVSRTGYRPPELIVRGEITGTIVTGTVAPTGLQDLDHDPGVVAVEISKPLDGIQG